MQEKVPWGSRGIVDLGYEAYLGLNETALLGRIVQKIFLSSPQPRVKVAFCKLPHHAWHLGGLSWTFCSCRPMWPLAGTLRNCFLEEEE